MVANLIDCFLSPLKIEFIDLVWGVWGVTILEIVSLSDADWYETASLPESNP